MLLNSFQARTPDWIRIVLSLSPFSLSPHIQLPNLYHFHPGIQKILLKKKETKTPSFTLSFKTYSSLWSSPRASGDPTRAMERKRQKAFLQNSSLTTQPKGDPASGIHTKLPGSLPTPGGSQPLKRGQNASIAPLGGLSPTHRSVMGKKWEHSWVRTQMG